MKNNVLIFFFSFSLILIITNVKAQVNLNLGLAGYWNFNGNANDASGNNNNGTVFGATLTTDSWGNANGAYYFNGINSWIQVQNSPTLNFNSNSFSVYALINVQGYYQGPCHGNSIIGRGASDNNPGAFHIRYLDGYYTGGGNCANPIPDTLHENFVAGCNNVFSPSIVPPQYIQNNTWYCVIAVNDGTHLKVYVNGVLNYDATLQGNFTTSTEDIFIGRHNSGAYPYWMKGILDELRLYNRALNMQEIDSLCSYNPNPPVLADTIISDFSYYYPNICDSTIIQFVDLSSAINSNIISWDWNFGDGNTSVLQNPSHNYLNTGTYNVSLVVSNNFFHTDTFTTMVSVNNNQPLISAVASPPIVCSEGTTT